MSNYIEDFGEKIGGARKDLWRHRGLSKQDLEGLNLKEYAEYVTKDNIWPVPDWKTYKGKMENICIMYMKVVREKIPTRITFYGRDDDKKRAELYIELVRFMKDTCEKMRVESDINNVPKELEEFYRSHRELSMDYTLYYALKMNEMEIEDLRIECEIQNFPDEYKGIIKGILIRGSAGRYRLCNKTRFLTMKTFATKQEAIDYAKNVLINELEEKKKTKKKSDLVNVVRPQLEYIERFGPNIRGGSDATPEHMLKMFDFRGGEFGNWNTQDDRQACLNYACDAFVDLAFVLGVPLSFIGLGQSKDRVE